MRRAVGLAPLFFFLAFLACTSGTTTAPSDGGVTTAAPCTGDPTRCLTGKVVAKGFTVPFSGAKVELYGTFPYGMATPLATSKVGADGTYAFGDLAEGGHYYAQAIARFDSSGTA